MAPRGHLMAGALAVAILASLAVAAPARLPQFEQALRASGGGGGGEGAAHPEPNQGDAGYDFFLLAQFWPPSVLSLGSQARARGRAGRAPGGAACHGPRWAF
jgi:hypothetical protein